MLSDITPSITAALVLGGGLAGLHAARLLRRAGVDVHLVEARDRLGGRIQTTGEGFDLGPSWFWPQAQPAIGALVADLGLRAFAQATDGDALVDRRPAGAPQRHPGFHPAPPSMRVAGGTTALIEALRRDLPADRVHPNTCAVALTLSETGVHVLLRDRDGADRVITAQQVVAALPPRLFEATVALDPAPPPALRRLWRGTPTWMAPHAKVVAAYDRPFWREAGLSGMAQSLAGPLAEIHDATTAEGRAALFGFVGLAPPTRAAMGEAALAEACVAQLVRLFGAPAARPLVVHVKDWAADPLTATPADLADGGHPVPVARWVEGDWAARLVMAGSETGATAPGYLAGAVEAGERAAADVVQRLGAPRG